jgi:hypothetical protein
MLVTNDAWIVLVLGLRIPNNNNELIKFACDIGLLIIFYIAITKVGKNFANPA